MHRYQIIRKDCSETIVKGVITDICKTGCGYMGITMDVEGGEKISFSEIERITLIEEE